MFKYLRHEPFIDFGCGEVVDYKRLLDELIRLVTPDAKALGCVDEINWARNILERGNSARRQKSTFDEALAAGKSADDALCDVVDMLVADTIRGT